MTPRTLQSSFEIKYTYKVHFTRGIFNPENSFFREWWKSLAPPPKVVFVIDEGLLQACPPLQADIQRTMSLLGHPQVTIIPVTGGEICKTDPKYLETVLKGFHDLNLCRHSLVFGVGGGALLDLVGYASTICHRGLRHVRLPSTVLAQNDSGVGVKNGVNAFGKKNVLGTFAPPEAVLCDFDFLNSLNAQDRSSGYAEAIKVALLKDANFYAWIREQAQALKAGDASALETLVMRCAELHMQHIAQGGDPFEKGSSRPLDFGHWSAHRLEYMSNYQLSHGQAVALGLCCDIHYAKHMGWINQELATHIVATIQQVGLPISHALFSQTEQILKGLKDFQEHLGGQLTITAIRGIADCFDIHEVNLEKLGYAFKDMLPPA